MAEVENNRISVIKQKDPNLPDYLDFEMLREEGLEHIGNLSGKIWTDHNTHDPGITVLEVLVYAIMDLGYKTNLPFKDLIAFETRNGKDDNFLTPLEVLTSNPVTITDYRKLLLEVKGVRNAWLESIPQKEELFLNPNNNTLFCKGNTPDISNEAGVTFDQYKKVKLNGLYKVYLEKGDKSIDDDQLIKDAKKILNAHRNLCEDFSCIEVLTPLDIGICLEAELHPEYTPEKIYKEIFTRIRQYIQPEIHYYTLEELLDKGKTIDEVFAGRPFREESFGFVDTEELENFDRRSVIHLSDVYQVILNIEGVRKIKNIVIKGGQIINQYAQDWIEANRIPDGFVPVFSAEKTCIDLYNTRGALQIDKVRVHKSFSFDSKFIMSLENLDTSIPPGKYREDLEEYYSIQNDFPVVYGIGDDGLPERASLLQKTQVLQFKGYLLFYDQILANYTSQLSNIRSLFSLKPENQRNSEEKQTYFTQIPDSIPELEKLLRFYDQNETIPTGSLLAVPVANNVQWRCAIEVLEKDSTTELTIGNYCNDKKGLVDLFSFSSAVIRKIYINQLQDSFFNEQYTIQVIQDRKGYFFVIHITSSDDILLVGTKKYQKRSDARREAKNIAFIATLDQSYHLSTNASETVMPDQHFFDITYTPLSYIDLIQDLTEDKNEYITRRKKFLDHLLARFGEEFTEYTLLLYQNKMTAEKHSENLIESQSIYINKFAEVSRNRGKAFDYLEPSWDTENVSGFEKRVSLLSGIENYKRRNLCNFEVVQCFRLQLKDWTGAILFRSNKGFETQEELYDTARKVIVQLRNPESYKTLEKNLNGFNAKAIHHIFSELPATENIIITKYNYHQHLCNANDEIVVVSKSTKMRSQKVGVDKKDDFIKNINAHTIINPSDTKKEYRLLPLDGKNRYLDANALQCDIHTLISWKWHVYNNINEDVSCEQIFLTSDQAWDDMVQGAKLDNYLTRHEVALKWKLTVNQEISITGLDCYPDAYRAVAAWRQAKVIGSNATRYAIEKIEGKTRILLKNEKDRIVATSNVLNSDSDDLDTIIQNCTTIFNNRSTKPDYDKEKEKFGFQIFGKNNMPICVSYCVYDTAKEALQQIGVVFELGNSKKNYLLSGDQGNPEYNFILRDKYNSFLALPTDLFETESDRTKALNAMMRFIKSNTLPVYVKEEPRRYVWTLSNEENKILSSEIEFSSKARAQADFDKVIVSEVNKTTNELYTQHCYEFDVVATPAQYKYIYGGSNMHYELDPVFISHSSFNTYEEASKGYTEFTKKLPGLILRKGNESTFEFAIYSTNDKSPLATQYIKANVKASFEKAKAITGYISKIYTKVLSPKDSFITREMIENQKGQYEWRFYKKHMPLAASPYRCTDKSLAARIASLICDIVPPVKLKQCPQKEIIVCPPKDPYKYHYQICFKDQQNNEFVLISYVGYTSYTEAEEAYYKQWLDVIQVATNRDEYGTNGKISIHEIYKNPEDKSCNDASFIAVIPETISDSIEGPVRKLVDYYVRLADIFPLYKGIDPNIEEPKIIYKFKVVVPERIIEDYGCKYDSVIKPLGTLLWESTKCYDDALKALEAYCHFYNLAGTSNNCRLFCKEGQFYAGLVEVLAESLCEFDTYEEAWDDIYPDRTDDCENCIPGGVREFVYAAEEDKNYIPVCDQNYWKFKVVSPAYFVVNHNCDYDSVVLRDKEMQYWITKLENINWNQYLIKPSDPAGDIVIETGFLSRMEYKYTNKELCDLVFVLREVMRQCDQTESFNENIKPILNKRYEQNTKLCQVINNTNFNYKEVEHLALYFPVYKTDKGYGYRLYWPENDMVTTPQGLQPCGCGDEVIEISKPCNEPYPFVSSNYYECCTEALRGFIEFCRLITQKLYSIECISKTEYGPYSFQITNKQKELAYHPQQYESLQEVKKAINNTKACVNDVGMHLLEHILLRPKNHQDCAEVILDAAGNQIIKNCLLPVCPDYDCEIVWQLDMDRDDPCAGSELSKIDYIPGSDPYSFWATLVLPSWHKRFRTKESRDAFEKFLYREVPALVGLHILWLSPKDLCKFEDSYRKWLEWRQNPKALKCYPGVNSLTCVLSDCIKTLESEPPCLSVPGQQGDCDCEKKDKEGNVLDGTSGSLFWGYCPPDYQPPQDTTGADIFISDQISPTKTRHPKKDNKETVKPKKPVKKSNRIKESGKTGTKKVVPKKKKATKSIPKKTTEEIISSIRKRKPKYLKNIKDVADAAMVKTKSYERTEFFLKNTPTVSGYTKLVNFFNRYSLQKDNKIENFLTLLENATWHLLDHLVLDKNTIIKSEYLDQLEHSFSILNKKGVSLKTVYKAWKSEDLKNEASPESLVQIKKLLN